MPFMRRREFISFTGAVAAMLLAVLASGEARAVWPERTVTIIVPFPPGGPNDLLGRLLAAELAPKLRHCRKPRRRGRQYRARHRRSRRARRLHLGGRHRCGADQSERR